MIWYKLYVKALIGRSSMTLRLGATWPSHRAAKVGAFASTVTFRVLYNSLMIPRYVIGPPFRFEKVRLGFFHTLVTLISRTIENLFLHSFKVTVRRRFKQKVFCGHPSEDCFFIQWTNTDEGMIRDESKSSEKV
ncbi:unnamed protein product [Colias eurytheme]|nr:unnamed protein product [Colias eurytheme]